MSNLSPTTRPQLDTHFLPEFQHASTEKEIHLPKGFCICESQTGGIVLLNKGEAFFMTYISLLLSRV